MVTIEEIRVGDASQAWRAVGFEVDDELCRIGSVDIRLDGDEPGISRWTLSGIPTAITSVDGIPTGHGSPGSASTMAPAHPNGVVGIDHLVLMTPNLPRTREHLAAIGLEARRERDAGEFRQVFYRLDDVILELVGPAEPGPGDARLWGLTFVVRDIVETAEFLGGRIGRVKDAVQAGRRITTLRGRELGISPAIAFMSPRPPRDS